MTGGLPSAEQLPVSEMADTRTVPEIRFKGFEEEWEEREERRFDEIAPLQRGFDLPKSEMNEGCYPVVMSNGINGYHSEFKVKGPGVITGRSGTIGNLHYVDTNYWPHNTALWVTDFKGNQPLYVYYMYLKLDLKRFGTGSGVPTLNRNDVHDQKVRIPGSSEQSQIGTFFQNLDSLITLHQCKYDKLTTVKKAMLKKMFPKEGADAPEIRFKGFPEKWVQWTLGEILTEIRRPIELKDEHEYELVTVKRRNEGVVSRGKLKGRDILVKTYFELRSGDYIISKRQIVHGANGVVPQSLDKAIVSNEYLVAVGNDKITTDFFALISKLPSMYKLFFLSSYGIDIEKLVFDVTDWKKRYVVVPCPAEQQRLTSFFHKLDSLITLQQRELDKLKNIKKACLEKMFV